MITADRTLGSLKELYETLSCDNSTNFVAVACTQWNALSIDALLMMLEDKGIIINAAIVIAEHKTGRYLIDESFFSNTCSQYFWLPFSGGRDIKNGIKQKPSKWKDVQQFYRIVFGSDVKNNSNVLYYSTFNHTIPDAVIKRDLEWMGRPLITCRTEEGLGPYMGTFDKTYPQLSEVRGWREFHGYLRAVFFGREVYRLLHTTYSSLIFKRTLFGLKPNPEVFPYYRKLFRKRNEVVRPNLNRDLIQDAVVICTSSWYREEIIDDEDFRVMLSICDALSTRGQKLLLKPHPRDRFFPTKLKELHCELLDVPGLTIESLCEYAQPKAIIGYPSSSLINPKIFWNIPTYCIADMLNRDKLAIRYCEEIDQFKRAFRHIVPDIRSISDIVVE